MASWFFGLTLIFGLIGSGMSQDPNPCPNGTTVTGELPMPLTYTWLDGSSEMYRVYSIEQCKLVDISGDGLADLVCESRRDDIYQSALPYTCRCSYQGNAGGAGFALIDRTTNDGRGCYQWPTPPPTPAQAS